MIRLMYITNQPEYAKAAVKAGVDRIFVDLEYLGKEQRQGGMDTVRSHHTVQDVRAVRAVVQAPAQLLVRVNPIHGGSADEINAVIRAGADIVMLPMWKSADEVRKFVRLVGGRARVMPLLETAQAVEALDGVLDIPGIDEMYIGLNDLYLSRQQDFIFCPLADGTVDALCGKLCRAGVPFGFGGVASMDGGLLQGALVLGEHVRLGSQAVILSRSFCRTDLPIEAFSRVMTEQIAILRRKEKALRDMTAEQAAANHARVSERIEFIVKEKRA